MELRFFIVEQDTAPFQPILREDGSPTGLVTMVFRLHRETYDYDGLLEVSRWLKEHARDESDWSHHYAECEFILWNPDLAFEFRMRWC